MSTLSIVKYASLTMLVAGCATTTKAPVAMPAEVDARTLPMFDGHSGDAYSWDDVMALAVGADVIVLGEQHNDAVAHAMQLAIVEEVLNRWPGSAVSLEMLERDEQRLVDDYLEGVIDTDQLAELTFSSQWAGEGSWTHWYQPVIDAAKESDSPVVAANAPRRYVRLARTDGYERLESLPPPRREFVDMPDQMPEGGYRDRFWDIMGGHDVGGSADGGTDADAVAQAEAAQERIESMFRSQCVWDATMAASIASARNAGAPKVVHLVGQFHSDFEGGLVQQLYDRLPGQSVMVISMQAADGGSGLRSEDVGRADVVVYTDE